MVALFCILMMVAMMWTMMGGMSAFHSGPTDSRDTKREVRERADKSSGTMGCERRPHWAAPAGDRHRVDRAIATVSDDAHSSASPPSPRPAFPCERNSRPPRAAGVAFA